MPQLYNIALSGVMLQNRTDCVALPFPHFLLKNDENLDSHIKEF